jgi:probable rRNA maturation factor
LGSPDGELSILIVSDQEIADLNKTYLDRSGPTNVMAFPMQEGPFGDITPRLLGDVVISLDTAAREAQQAGMTTESRFDQLLVHGILHLFGFDHDKTAGGAKAMRIKEEELLKLLYPSKIGF